MMIPHKCPVCQGTGIVGAGFYNRGCSGFTTRTNGEQCRTCWGSGIVWEAIPVKHFDPWGVPPTDNRLWVTDCTADDMVARER